MDKQNNDSDTRDNNTDNQSEPQDNQSVLIQHILRQFTNEFVLIGVRIFNVLGGSVDLTISKGWEKNVSWKKKISMESQNRA